MTTDIRCRWVASDRPRVVADRHGDECAGENCAGCLPCLEPHCRVCGRTHAEQTCPECIAETRSDLREIGRLCDSLPEEVEHRGIDGEAMMLLGPVANPESIGHVRASIAAGRLPKDWLDVADNDRHPLSVAWWWNECYREAFDHSEAERADLGELIDYLDRNLAYAAGFADVPFEDFARDLRQSRAHIETVLHDGEQRDTGAPCMTCRIPLVREWGRLAAADGWRCPRCREFSTDNQYRIAVMDLHRDEAEWLTDKEMQLRTGIKAGTVRSWARNGDVRKMRDSERTVYAVADVTDLATVKGLIA